MQIANPVLPGFNADPSMIRVGDTYYIANSTFEWFPGVRLHESKDMVHWNLLPSPLSRTSQLDMRGNLADLHGREGRERCVQGLHELFGHCRKYPWSVERADSRERCRLRRKPVP